ncbi:MAG TPA: ABC transporter substrate-binding protein [Chloroflexota bacterium]|nr:ABC transporter substrate-binding protein [Chloroflexota bacterium]
MSPRSVRCLSALAVGVTLLACSSTRPTANPSGPSSSPAAAAASAAAEVSGQPVAISANQGITSNLIIWLAQEAGLFASNGVNVDLQSINAMVAMKALVAGELQGIWVGGAEVVGARASGAPLTIVGVWVPVYNQVMMAAPGIAAVPDLRGKTIGVITYPSVNGVGTLAAMRSFGMENGRDYRVVETGSAGVYQGLAAQLVAGNVDAALLPPELARTLTPDGYTQLFDQVSLSTAAVSSTLAFRDEFLQQQPATVQKIVDALILAVRYAREHRAETQDVLRKDFRVTDPSDLDLLYDRLTGQVFAREPYPIAENFADTVEGLARDAPEVRSVDINTMIDRRFVDDAVRRGLTQY